MKHIFLEIIMKQYILNICKCILFYETYIPRNYYEIMHRI